MNYKLDNYNDENRLLQPIVRFVTA